eukprot:s2665_g2.t2
MTYLTLRAFVAAKSPNSHPQQNLGGGSVLAEIPKSAVLSIRNTVLAADLAAAQLDLDPALRLAICAERALKSRSKWHGYFQSLLRPYESLPYLWSPTLRENLRGTDAEDTVKELMMELEAEFAELRHILDGAPALKGVCITLEDYLHAATLASSRAFTVDDFHLEALVPLADVFNHRCQKVPKGEAVRELSGKAPQKQLGATGAAHDAFGVWQGKVPPMQIALAETTEVHQAKRSGTGPSGHLMIYVLTDLAANVEIFNTYGEFSNDKLLQDYGFVLEQNAFNTVTLARSFLEGAGCRRQMAWAMRHRKMLGLTQENSDDEMEGAEEEDPEDDPTVDGHRGISSNFVTFFELPNAAAPRRSIGRKLWPVWPRQLRTLLAVLSTPGSKLDSQNWQMKQNQRRLWWNSRARALLRRALRRRWAQYPEPCEASEDRRRWRSCAEARDSLGLRIGEKEILEHFLKDVSSPLSRKRRILREKKWRVEVVDGHLADGWELRQLSGCNPGKVKHYDGDFRFYMDSNADVRRKVEEHYTGIDGLIESVPASLEERRKKETPRAPQRERKGLRKHRRARVAEERQQVLNSSFLSNREWRR